MIKVLVVSADSDLAADEKYDKVQDLEVSPGGDLLIQGERGEFLGVWARETWIHAIPLEEE